MYGPAAVAAVFIISLLVFPKYRLHIIAGSVVIGLFLYFTTDRDIRDNRRPDTDIRLKEISVQNAVLEWNGHDSVFTGRLRNSSRDDLAALDLRFIIASCSVPETAQQLPDGGFENASDISAETPETESGAEKQVLIHGVFYDFLHAKDIDIIKESQHWTQRRHPGKTVTDCKITDKSEVSFTLPKILPRGRGRDTAIPVSFDAPLPQSGNVSWYWALTAAYKMKELPPEQNAEIETDKPEQPEQPE